jgi:hypothetical protein
MVGWNSGVADIVAAGVRSLRRTAMLQAARAILPTCGKGL